jgi:2-polyprenyl-3-methyl-5-hydroxy-6-metoxy-1,4-benzoquinol methylase
MMGFFKFSAVLTREITEEEFAILQEAGCAGGTLSTSVLPVNDNTVVTQIDFDKGVFELARARYTTRARYVTGVMAAQRHRVGGIVGGS